MDQHQQRRLAAFVVNRENMHNSKSTDARCALANYYLEADGTFVVEVQWQLSGLPDLTLEPYFLIPPEEIESLRGVWMVAATANRGASPTPTTSAAAEARETWHQGTNAPANTELWQPQPH